MKWTCSLAFWSDLSNNYACKKLIFEKLDNLSKFPQQLDIKYEPRLAATKEVKGHHWREGKH